MMDIDLGDVDLVSCWLSDEQSLAILGSIKPEKVSIKVAGYPFSDVSEFNCDIHSDRYEVPEEENVLVKKLDIDHYDHMEISYRDGILFEFYFNPKTNCTIKGINLECSLL